MHRRNVILLFLILTGVALAQETNFSSGPQYLITTNSPLLLRPISTPSLTLGQLPTPGTSFTTGEAAVAQEAPAPSTITNQTFLSDVYWGDHPATEVEGRRLSTPSLPASETSASVTAPESTPANSEALPGLPVQARETSSVIEISSGALPANLPASIFDPGVTAMADPQSLRERGYGIPLGDVAAYWKVHKISAARSFTNRDVDRLHGG